MSRSLYRYYTLGNLVQTSNLREDEKAFRAIKTGQLKEVGKLREVTYGTTK